jgi:hypothetical protein
MFFYSESEPSILDAQGWTLQIRQTWEDGDTDHLSNGDLTYLSNTTSISTIQHSSLSSPLTTGGEKGVYIDSAHAPYHSQRLYATRPDLVGTPANMGISLRACLRGKAQGGGYWFDIRGKSSDNGDYTRGYEVGIPFTTSWKNYRLDMEPQFSNGTRTGDKITFYTADITAGEPNWIISSETIRTDRPAGDPNLKYHMLGWIDYSPGSPNLQFYLDNFEVYTKLV